MTQLTHPAIPLSESRLDCGATRIDHDTTIVHVCLEHRWYAVYSDGRRERATPGQVMRALEIRRNQAERSN